MKGLVNCAGEPELFQEEVRGTGSYKYVRTGAAKLLKLTLNHYQQALRYMHFVDNTKNLDVEHDDYDKCYRLRPLIVLLQSAFFRWANPGKNNAMDEGPIPSKFRWLRNFNPDKPHQYYIEILMGCDSVTRFCWGFFINEKTEKRVKRRNRRLPPGKTTGRGKRQSYLEKVPHYQHECVVNNLNSYFISLEFTLSSSHLSLFILVPIMLALAMHALVMLAPTRSRHHARPCYAPPHLLSSSCSPSPSHIGTMSAQERFSARSVRPLPKSIILRDYCATMTPKRTKTTRQSPTGSSWTGGGTPCMVIIWCAETFKSRAHQLSWRVGGTTSPTLRIFPLCQKGTRRR